MGGEERALITREKRKSRGVVWHGRRWTYLHKMMHYVRFMYICDQGRIVLYCIVSCVCICLCLSVCVAVNIGQADTK